MAQSGLVITNLPRSEWYAPVLSSPAVIGRGQGVDILIPQCHVSVSRRHAIVWSDRAGIWIQDLASTCGTFVNRLQLAQGRDFRIAPQDRILLGKLELTLIDDESSLDSIAFDGGAAIEDDSTLVLQPADEVSQKTVLRGLESLSNAEQEVVLWVSRGYTTPEAICQQLKRSAHTVRTQFNSIFKKLGVHSRDELIGYLLRRQRNEDTVSD